MKLKNHLYASLSLTLIIKVCVSYFAYGALALDDYRHGFLPAYQLATDQFVDLPAYRSYLIIWPLSWLFQLAQTLGISTATSQVRFMYLWVGLYSLLINIAVYILVRNFKNDKFKVASLYVIPLAFMLPYFSTRVFGETLCIPFVLLGFAFIERYFKKNEPNEIFIAFLFLGIATLLRFHVGVIFISLAALLTWYKKDFVIIKKIVLSGLVVLITQIIIDLLSHKYPMQTLLEYLKVNEGGAKGYGVTPWYSTWFLALAFTSFPLSTLFYNNIIKTFKRLKFIMVPTVIFVAIHSMVPHKEERFLLPVAPLLTLFSMYLWSISPSFKKKSLFLFFFIPIQLFLLGVSSFSNSQDSELKMIEYLDQKPESTVIVSFESVLDKSFIRDFYLRDQYFFEQADFLNFSSEFYLNKYKDISRYAFITSNLKYFKDFKEKLNKTPFSCSKTVLAQSFGDKILYQINPSKNKKRAPTLFMICSRSTIAHNE